MIEGATLNDLLWSYAAGRLARPVALAVATHAALCPASRVALGLGASTGGVLMDELAPEAMRDGAWARCVAELQMAPVVMPGRATPSSEQDRLPDVLRGMLPAGGMRALSWRHYGPVAEAIVDTGNPDYRTSLIRLKAGRKVFRHTHEGREITVVLHGAFHDELGQYQPGDLILADGGVEHQPTAEPGEDCLCLAVTDAPLRLTGPFGRFLNPLLRL